MFSNHHDVVRPAHQPDPVLSQPATVVSSDADITSSDRRNLTYARTYPFAADARVAGFLLDADIDPTSYGTLYDVDLTNRGEFIQFSVMGIDHRAGYDIVRSDRGVAYVMVSYATHARERGMEHLKEHIAINADWYAARSLAGALPWPHSPVMVAYLEATWLERLSPLKAHSRIAALQDAQQYFRAK